MKTFVRSLALVVGLFSAAPALAQTIPSGDFETWVTRNASEAPQSWLTTDDVAAVVLGMPLPFSTNTVVKSTDKRSGNFAAKLETRSLLGQNIPGLLIIGARYSEDADFPGGVPFTGRPTRLQLYYKLTGPAAAADEAIVQVFLSRTINGVVEPIGGVNQVLAPQANYTLLDLPLTYLNNNVPDTLRLAIGSSSIETPTVGTTLFVDDLTFVGGTQSTRDAALANALNVYPNPSNSGMFSVAARGRETELANATLTVSDALGRTVLQQPAARAATARTLDLRAQPTGIYTLRLDTPTGFAVQKLVKQ